MESMGYFIFVMWLLNGYKCSSPNGTRTLMITDNNCDAMNSENNTMVKYEPFKYADVSMNEKEILELLNNGQSVYVSDYVDYKQFSIKDGPFLMSKHTEWYTLCNYIVNDRPYTDMLLGSCDMETDGILCYTLTLITNDVCEKIDKNQHMRYFYEESMEYLCVSNKKFCPEANSERLYVDNDELRVVHNFMKLNAHNVYSTETRQTFYTFDEPTGFCLKLHRIFDRLFVQFDYCGLQMDHLCWNIFNGIETSESSSSKEQTLHFTLLTIGVGVGVFMLSVAGIVIAIRRRIHQNTNPHDMDNQGTAGDNEMQTFDSTNDDSNTGHNAGGGALPVNVGAQGGNITGHIARGGALPVITHDYVS